MRLSATEGDQTISSLVYISASGLSVSWHASREYPLLVPHIKGLNGKSAYIYLLTTILLMVQLLGISPSLKRLLQYLHFFGLLW